VSRSGADLPPTSDHDDTVEVTEVAAPAALRRQAASGPGTSSINDRVTQQLPNSRSFATPTGATGIETGHTTAATSMEALQYDEIQRTRIFLKIIMAVIVLIGGSVLFVRGEPAAKYPVYVAMSIVGVITIGLHYHLRDETNYDINQVTALGLVIAVCAFAGVYFFGAFSPAPALILLGIYFFSLGASFRATLAIYVTCAICQATLGTLIIAEVIPDYGTIRADRLAVREQVMVQCIVQFLYLLAFVMARSSRRSTLKAVTELEGAIRAVAQRDALLLEARQDLDRALKIGGAGRFSEQLIGAYKLGVLIGRGGMGEVYEATNTVDNTDAAVKLLHAHVMNNPSHVKRFVRETEAIAKLDTDNVVRVLDVGTTEGQVPFLAMERLRGHDLSHFLRRKRRLSAGRVVAMVRQVGIGLAAAKAAEIVHRDIKPQNLFLADGPQRGATATWKILDFGVSKLGGHGGTLTKGHVVGTPGYMAPEQARGDQVDYRADIYALAAIAYRALTGHPPFSGKDVPTTLYDVVYAMPTRPSDLVPQLPEDIDLVLAIGLAKKPEDRFDSGEELADALAAGARSNLDEVLRTMGRELIQAHPWGESL
jgi:serine/threonine-protein kinase